MRVAKYQKSLTISLSKNLFSKIKKITDERQISLSEFMREAAENHLSRKQNPEEINNES